MWSTRSSSSIRSPAARRGCWTRSRSYANSHYVTPRPTLQQAMKGIKEELRLRLDDFRNNGKLLEAQRLEQRTNFDMEMIEATGSCAGIENYSRWLTGRKPGEPPPTLFEYLPRGRAGLRRREPCQRAADRRHVSRRLSPESHPRRVRLPPAVLHRQPPAEIRGMGRDAAADRLWSARTPGPWELERTGGVFAEQVIRPTGLIDPPVEIRPVESQVDDLIAECRAIALKGYRALVTTLTKKMAEDLTEYMHEQASACATCTRMWRRWSASRSSAICASAPSTC